MKKSIIFLLLVFVANSIFAQNIAKLISNSTKETVISFTMSDYYLKKVSTPDGIKISLFAENANSLMIAGSPDLLKMTSTFIIPDLGNSNVEVVYQKFEEIENIDLISSKGNLTRDIDPSTVAYTYGEVYNKNEFFPKNLADLSTPFIARDYRGQSVNVYPFQYNPVTKVLRIYTEITVKVTYNSSKGVNEFNKTKQFSTVQKDFNDIYQSRFINFANENAKYTPVEEEGTMLIICYDDFMDEMQPLVDWKNTIGRPTVMVSKTTAGSSATAIKTYVTNYYNNNNLAYLLLIGDATQIPTNSGSGLGGESDNAYAYITGSDHYQEFFVGRFSAENAAQVTTQVQRTITYENGSTLATGWLNVPMGVASSGGPGDDNEYDYEHIRNILTQLVDDYTYVEPYFEVYDGSQGGFDVSGNATPAQVAAAINTGTGFINYCGHGSDTYWVSSYFSVSDVDALTNDNKLPFIISVACVNGNFVGQTCFGEAWMRSTNGSNPAGAIGIYASTINQSWDPPMVAQDEMTDILVESYNNNIKRTFAGIAINGMFLMNDETQDYAMTDTWICFGDPSLMVRTDNPVEFENVVHDGTIIMGSTTFDVNCSLNGALACISKDAQIIGTAYVTGGVASIPLENINPGDVVTLAIVGFNKITYLADITVIAPSGPYVSMISYNANGSQAVNYNSTSNIEIELKNYGPAVATSVTATLVSNSPYISVVNGTNISFGDITNDGGVATNNTFSVSVANNVPDQTNVPMTLTITSTNKEVWTKDFNITVNSPLLEGSFASIEDNEGEIAFSSSPITLVDLNTLYTYSITVNELGGNGNGNLDAGEIVNLVFEATNIGHASIENSYGTLTTTSPYITINNAETFIANLAIGESFSNVFNITVDESAPVGTMAEFEFEFGTVQFETITNISLPLGLVIEDFESGNLTNYNWVLDGDANWTASNTGAHAGTYCAKSGDIDNNETTSMQVTLNNVPAGQTMSFWYKASSESGWDFLTFYVNGQMVEEWSGNVAWTEKIYTFTTAGDYTIKFEYSKDYSETSGQDCGWIDDIVFPVGPTKTKGAKAITIEGTTLPSWASLTDNGDGTATLSGTTPNYNVDEAIILTASNGSTSSTQEFTIRVGVVSINTIENVISFYPNPTSDILNINFESNQTAQMRIVDISGKLFIQSELNQTNQIDLTNLPQGVYFININVDGKEYQNKMIKK